MNRLYLLRHAKSSWSDPTLTDFDRPLNKRGDRASALIARHIRKAGIAPELVLCSPAKRALQTLDALRPVWNDRTNIEIVDECYDATTEVIRSHLRAHAGKVTSIMLIGHNPEIQDLSLKLSNNYDDSQYRGAQRKFPTGGLAQLSAPRDVWENMRYGGFTFHEFVQPRELERIE